MRHALHHWWQSFALLERVLALALGVLLLFFGRIRQRFRENQAAGWPTTDAVIQAVRTTSQQGRQVEISYRYHANGEYRYGKQIRYFGKKAEAETFADALRGRTLLVRYRADQPDTSLITDLDLELVTGVWGPSKAT